jgi:hypothetical protein
MLRKFIAVAAVSGTLALGVTGVTGVAAAAAAAGPATSTSTSSSTSTSTSTPPSPATQATRCARAEKVAVRVHAAETKAATWVPKAQAREAKATAAGHTKVAGRIGRRIARVQKRETRGTALLAKISAKCGSATGAS